MPKFLQQQQQQRPQKRGKSGGLDCMSDWPSSSLLLVGSGKQGMFFSSTNKFLYKIVQVVVEFTLTLVRNP
jgi:hypothetical protein